MQSTIPSGVHVGDTQECMHACPAHAKPCVQFWFNCIR